MLTGSGITHGIGWQEEGGRGGVKISYRAEGERETPRADTRIRMYQYREIEIVRRISVSMNILSRGDLLDRLTASAGCRIEGDDS